MKIGNKLKSIRVEKGCEPIDVAEGIGVSLSTYRRYERDLSSPSLNLLDKISNFFDVSILDLLPESISQTNNEQKGGVASVYYSNINNLSEKFIEIIENQLKDKDKIITEKDSLIESLICKLIK